MSEAGGGGAGAGGPRSVVFGYHAMGCVGFDALLRQGFEVAAVFTHRDDPHEEVWWPSLADRAAARGIPVHDLGKADAQTPELAARVRQLAPDFLFSFYFRYLLPTAVLDGAARGAYNLHGSLLPRYRGRAPVNWVLVNGESETGVTLHSMVAKADAGDIVDQERVAIDFEDTALSLYRKLEGAAARLLDRTLPKLREGTATPTPMNLAAGSYFGGRTPADGRIDWNWPALRVYNLVRAVTHPYPGAFTVFGGRTLTVWWATPDENDADAAPGTVTAVSGRAIEVATGSGTLRIMRAQLENADELDAAALARAAGIVPGTWLGE
jgi:methionyl-tRNA formyltransferase